MAVWLFVVLLILVGMMHLTILWHETVSSTSASSIIDVNQTEHINKAVKLVQQEGGVVDVNRLLFIHVPKCGGTAFTSLLRKIQCHRNSTAFPDCCHNPGSCYIKGFRRCISILGCVSHFPRRSMLGGIKYSTVLLRHPVTRTISAWYYAGHNPNNDAFDVRPEFVEIRKGRLPKVTFQQYVRMSEYRDVQTRMLGADSFPYRNITVDDKVLRVALEAVDQLFFVGLQEEMLASGLLLLRRMDRAERLLRGNENTGMEKGLHLDCEELRREVLNMPRERSTSIASTGTTGISSTHTEPNRSVTHLGGSTSNNMSGAKGSGNLLQLVNGHSQQARAAMEKDPGVVGDITHFNRFDVTLYEYGRKRFCSDLADFPDLYSQLINPEVCRRLLKQ